MQAKWLNGFNESTQQNEQFYPITHKDAIIGAEEFVLTEEADEIEGDIPDIDPVVNNRINEIIAYVNEKLAHAGSGSGGSGSTAPAKLEMYTLHVIATTDGQTTFGISLSDFDSSRDYVLVQSERLMLSPDLDFTISGKNIVLNEGVENGRNITIYVFKSADKDDEESEGGSFSVLDIPDGTITLTKLVEPVLPLRGGTLSGDLNFTRSNSNKKTQVFHYGDHSFIRNMEADGKTYADIYFSTNTMPQYRGKDGIDYDIYGEYNPPKCNNNILINSNFANPVNQRGVTSGVVNRYSYTLDRWKTNNNLNLTINTGKSITLSNTVNEEFYFFQIIEEFSSLDGKTLTLSAKVNGNVYSATGVIDLSRNECSYIKVQTEFGAIYVSRFDVIQFVFEGNGDATFTIEWAKLELGSIATPYVARTYAEELVLCQRYFETGKLSSNIRYEYSNTTYLHTLNFKTQKRDKPTVTINFVQCLNTDGQGTTATSNNIIGNNVDNVDIKSTFTSSIHSKTYAFLTTYTADAEL